MSESVCMRLCVCVHVTVCIIVHDSHLVRNVDLDYLHVPIRTRVCVCLVHC